MTRSSRFLVISCVVAIALGGALYRAVRTSAEPAAAPAPLAGGAARPASTAESPELAELRQQVFELRHQVHAHEQRLAADGFDKPTGPVRAEPPGPEERAEQERKRHEYVAGVEAAFRKEARDPQWSNDTSAAIQAALAANRELQALAGSVDCRSRTCRVEITDDGSVAPGKQIPMLAQQVGQGLPNMTADRVVDGSGRATMVLYFSRRVETASAP